MTWGPSGPGVLLPQEQATAIAQYTVTQADIDAGQIANTATVAGNAPNGDPISQTAAHTVTSTAVPHLTLTKTGAGAVDQAGDLVTYTFTALNDGPLTLQDVSITDPLPGLSQLTYIWPGAVGVLAPGQSVTATATYRTIQADVDAGQIVNTATARGQTLRGVPVSDDDTFTIAITRAAAIDLIKGASYVQGERGEAGDTIQYKFTATNTGNVTLTGVTITDPLPNLSTLTYTWPGTPGVLTPGQAVVATARYVVTQADVDGPDRSQTSRR